ncbi:MAG TPA: alpha/beta hydrolase [Solirubrobacteraceae bacterium]|jgi:pimeloyl-ACP methyl ester carboxylesterase|nr:alpha/beta hydrolase [Solirubrobacteraceae bacterium]
MSQVHEVELSAGAIRFREQGKGKSVVFIHGLLVNGTLWRKVLPLLAEDQFRCLVPDWPLGSHEAPMKPAADLSPLGVARLVAEFMEKLDLHDVTLVANDTGGAIVQLLAADQPERVGRLVLTPSDAFENFFPPIFRALQYAARMPVLLTAGIQPLRVRALRRLPIAFGLLSKRPIPAAVTDAWLRPFLTNRSIRRDTAAFIRAVNARDTISAAERLRYFQQPVLLAWASEDRLFPLEHAHRLAAILPNARVEEIHDSYTFVPEDQPERLAELIADFTATSHTTTGNEKWSAEVGAD